MRTSPATISPNCFTTFRRPCKKAFDECRRVLFLYTDWAIAWALKSSWIRALIPNFPTDRPKDFAPVETCRYHLHGNGLVRHDNVHLKRHFGELEPPSKRCGPGQYVRDDRYSLVGAESRLADDLYLRYLHRSKAHFENFAEFPRAMASNASRIVRLSGNNVADRTPGHGPMHDPGLDEKLLEAPLNGRVGRSIGIRQFLRAETIAEKALNDGDTGGAFVVPQSQRRTPECCGDETHEKYENKPTSHRCLVFGPAPLRSL